MRMQSATYYGWALIILALVGFLLPIMTKPGWTITVTFCHYLVCVCLLIGGIGLHRYRARAWWLLFTLMFIGTILAPFIVAQLGPVRNIVSASRKGYFV